MKGSWRPYRLVKMRSSSLRPPNEVLAGGGGGGASAAALYALKALPMVHSATQQTVLLDDLL